MQEDVSQEPTQSAEIEFRLGPAHSGKAVFRGVQTADMFIVAGAVVIACAGIAGAVETMKIRSGLTIDVMAELALALILSFGVLAFGFARAKQTRLSLSELTRQAELAKQTRQVELDLTAPDKPGGRRRRRKR